MSSAYACFVCGNFSVEDNPQSIGNYSHFFTEIGHHPPALNPNLPPNTETDPDPHENARLDVRLHKYVGSRGSGYFSDTYSPDDIVYAAGSGRIHVANESPRLELFTTHLNNLTPPQHHLQIKTIAQQHLCLSASVLNISQSEFSSYAPVLMTRR